MRMPLSRGITAVPGHDLKMIWDRVSTHTEKMLG